MLTSSETLVKDAIVEMYAGHVLDHQVDPGGSFNYLVIRVKSGSTLLFNLTKLAALYDTGTSMAAIKAASGFEHLDPMNFKRS